MLLMMNNFLNVKRSENKMRLFLICGLSLLLCACDKPEDNSSSGGPISFEIDSKSVSLPLTWIEPQILPPDYVQNGASSSIQAPTLVDLDNITLDNGVVINATPYLISELYVKKDSVTKYIKFDTPIPAYSQSEIDQSWNGSEVLNYTPLSNHLFEYESQKEQTTYPNARHFDAQERDLGELIQIYDRFMINAPSTLSEVVQLMNQECYVNDHFSHCNQYNGTPEEYGLDTYFAKSVSGLTINLWADDDEKLWGLATTPSLELTSSQRSDSLHLWMHPNLLINMESNDYSTSTGAWQGFVHEFYHNHGFEHESGWPSNNGVDDMFGEKVVNDYRKRIGNTLILPDILLNEEKVGFATYRIQLLSASDALSDIKLRLLSTQRLNTRVKEVSSSEFLVEFEVLPTTDVYLSAYSEESQQMSSTILSFVKEVTSQSEIENFDENISMWLTTYDKVSVSIKNGYFSDCFTLPSEGVSKNKIVEFESTAGFESKVIHDSTSDILGKGDKLKYVYNGDYWDLISN